MARPSVGTVPQAESRTALFAYVAARLHGSPSSSHDDFFLYELGIAVGRNGADAAARPHRFDSPRRRRRGASTGPLGRRDGALRDWLLVDEQRLGLETALIRFPGDGRRQTELLDILKATPGIRQVIETAPRREVVVIAVFADARARRALRSQLSEVAEQMIWDEIIEETQIPALTTWAALARSAASDEKLLIEEGE